MPFFNFEELLALDSETLTNYFYDFREDPQQENLQHVNKKSSESYPQVINNININFFGGLNFFNTTPYKEVIPTQQQKYNKGKWTKEEDELLKAAYEEYPNSWTQISNKIKVRDPQQCRARWNNYLAPQIKTCEWSEDEKERIINAYRIVGPVWNFVAQIVVTRGPIQCKNYWNKFSTKLKEEYSLIFQEPCPENKVTINAKNENVDVEKGANGKNGKRDIQADFFSNKNIDNYKRIKITALLNKS